MWIREAIVDPPRHARVGVVLGWVRVAALSLAAIAAGMATDALLAAPRAAGSSALLDWAGWLIAAAAIALVGALAGGAAEALPERIQAREERLWRGRMARAVFATDERGRRRLTASDGELLDAATVGVEKTAGYRATFLGPTLGSFTAPVIVLLCWAIAIDVVSAIVLTAFVALVPLVIVGASIRLRRSNAEYRRRVGRDTARYLDLLEGLGTLRLFGADRRYRERHAGEARATMRELGGLLARNQTMIVVNDGVFGILMLGAAVALVLWRLVSGDIGAGGALAGVLLAVLLLEPIDRVGRTFYVGLGGRARRDQLEELLAEASGETSGADGVSPENTRKSTGVETPMSEGGENLRSVAASGRRSLPEPISGTAPQVPEIVLEGVGVEIEGASILHEVSCVLPSRGTVAIVGPSGAGKTTLARTIQGHLQPSSGSLRFDGVEVSPAQRLAATTGVGQLPGVVTGTIAENLRIAAADADDDALWAALERAQLADEVRAMPRGLDTEVGERGALLSGGQMRRLAIARALLRDAAIVVLDEPTADLDRRTEHLVRAAIGELARDRTVVMIAHRLGALRDADTVLVVQQGRVTAIDPGDADAQGDAAAYLTTARGAES